MRPTDAFDDEPASDWLRTLATVDDWAVVRAKLDEAEAWWRDDPWLASEAVAAAELIASGRGRPPRSLPPEVEAFLDRVEAWPTDADARRAASLVAAIRDEAPRADAAPTWHAFLDDLGRRLAR